MVFAATISPLEVWKQAEVITKQLELTDAGDNHGQTENRVVWNCTISEHPDALYWFDSRW
jgi:hypothetical protein